MLSVNNYGHFTGKAIFWLCVRVYWRDFPDNSHLEHYTYALKIHVLLREINNYGNFSYSAMYFPCITSVFTTDMWDDICICYKQCKFGSNQPTMKGTLLEEHCTYIYALQWLWVSSQSVNNQKHFIWRPMYLSSCITAPTERIPQRIHTCDTRYMLLISCKFRCDRWVFKDTLLKEQCNVGFICFHHRHFPENSYLWHYTYVPQML